MKPLLGDDGEAGRLTLGGPQLPRSIGALLLRAGGSGTSTVLRQARQPTSRGFGGQPPGGGGGGGGGQVRR